MAKKKSVKTNKEGKEFGNYGLPELILFTGTLLAVLGVYDVVTNKYFVSEKRTAKNLSPTVIERKLSIEAAERSGQKTYQFKTNFIPGIGTITDPNAFLENWQKEAEKSQQ